MKIGRLKLKEVLKFLLIGTIVFLLVNSCVTYFIKIKKVHIYSNKVYSIGKYYNEGSAGRGAKMADYKFQVKNKTYKGAISLATFKDSNPRIGKNYIVVYNSKKPSENICFLNLEVHDSIRHYFKNGSLNQLPIEDYQRSVDSFFLKSLTGGLTKYFPPYYTKEDFPELKYLWEEK